jgi:hypothetical protein
MAPTSFLLLFLTAMAFSAQSQQLKVKRKGVTPLDVTKSTPANTSTYTLNQFNGKWQEVIRTDKKNSSVAFTDTLFYNFSGENVFSRDGVNMSMKGEAAIEPGNVLVAAADVFTIRSMNNNKVVLDDGEYLHTLVRKKEFWYETLPTNYVEPEKFTTSVSVNASALTGKWKVYRREAKPGTENHRILLRILNITEVKDDHTATGELTFYQTEKLETLPCTISLNDGRMRIATSKDSWTMNVYKADGKNLIFGDAGLMYYCKPL